MTAGGARAIASIVPVLDAMRAWAPVYRRWWNHPARSTGDEQPAPWSPADEERLAWLGTPGVDRLLEVAGLLRDVAADLGEAARMVWAVTDDTFPADVAARLTAAASDIDAHGATTATMARAVHRAGAELDALWEGLARRVSTSAEELSQVPGWPSIGDAHQEIDRADRARPGDDDRWRWLDELVERHGVVLTVLRRGLSELASVRTRLAEELADEAEPHIGFDPGPGAPGVVLGGTEGDRPRDEAGVRVATLPDGG